MDTMTEPRITIHPRLSVAGIKAIDELAASEQRSRSQMVRILLAEALKARKR